MSDMPSGADFREFIRTFQRLDAFEARERAIRGRGAFRDDELPIRGAARVIEWLEGGRSTPIRTSWNVE